MGLNSHTMFTMQDGTVKACGNNNYGQLGIGDTDNRTSPVDLSIEGVKQIADSYILLAIYSTQPHEIIFPLIGTGGRIGINNIIINEESGKGIREVEEPMISGGALDDVYLWTIPLNKKAISIRIR